MGLSVLEAANVGVRYLEPDGKQGLNSFTLRLLFPVLHLVT